MSRHAAMIGGATGGAIGGATGGATDRQPAMQALGSFSIAAGHPALPGHFPGAPLVPGVMLLEETIALVLRACPNAALAGLPQARFLAPVRPDQVVRVLAAVPPSDSRVGFVARAAEQDVLRGTLELRPAP